MRNKTNSHDNKAFITLKEFLPYLWPRDRPLDRFSVIGAVCALLLAKLASPLVPLFLKEVIDHLEPQDQEIIAVPIALIIWYGLMRIIAQVFLELQNALFARVGQHAVRRVAYEIFCHLHRLSLGFHLMRKTGALSRAVERGAKSIETLIQMSLFSVIPTIFEIVAVCLMLGFLFYWSYAFFTLITMVIYISVTLMTTHWRIQYVKRMNASDDEANFKAIDSLLNYETVKYFNNEEHEARRYDLSLSKYEKESIRHRLSLCVLNVAQGVVIAFGLIGVMLYAGFQVRHGQITVGAFIMLNAYLIQLYIPLNTLGFAYREIRQALLNMGETFSLKKEEPDIKDSSEAKSLILTQGYVEFSHVSFSYLPGRPILTDVSFVIPQGKTVAIVGLSGAGKSTIARLLYRFYNPQQGNISIDGSPLETLTLESVRRAIAVIPQDTVLFNDTLFYNILYGRPTATLEEVYEAAKLARIHDFILSLPQGYQTLVGERGLKLSGGEKQRVSIARSILKNPLIYIFDEATSALDTQTEKELQESLKTVSHQKTTLIIAHRLSTIVHAYQILVLHNGRIMEKGTHHELLKAHGLYTSLWEKQQKDKS